MGTTCPALNVRGIEGENLAWNTVHIDLDIQGTGTESWAFDCDECSPESTASVWIDRMDVWGRDGE